MPTADNGTCHPFRSAEARDRYLAYYDAAAESWPIPSKGETIRTDAGQTFVRVSGPTDGRPIVLLPGLWASSLMWTSVIEPLSRDFRTYAVDSITDFGRSRPSKPVKTMADCMSWLDGLFDELGLTDRVNLIGCSRGALLAAEYTLHAPGRLASAVWLSPAHVVRGPSAGSLVGGVLYPAVLARPSRTTVGALMRWLMPTSSHPDSPYRAQLDRDIDAIVLGLQSYEKAPLGSGRVFTDDELGAIDVPVLYIGGERERMYSAIAAAARLNSVAPKIATEVVRGASHDLPGAQPEAFSGRVLEFLG